MTCAVDDCGHLVTGHGHLCQCCARRAMNHGEGPGGDGAEVTNTSGSIRGRIVSVSIGGREFFVEPDKPDCEGAL